MIEKIKQIISQSYSLEESKGFFISCFDKDNNLIISNGVLKTDKSLGKVIDMIYHGLVENHTEVSHYICDIITSITPRNTLNEINDIKLFQEGICIQSIDNTKSGVILPNTMSIHSIQEAFAIIKQKHHIEGNINVYSFITHRIEII